MPTNFPTSVDNFTNPTANDSLNLPSHSTQHANANDAIEAIEAAIISPATYPNQLVNATTATVRPLPFAMAVGKVTVNGGTQTTVTYPAGRFTQQPIVNYSNMNVYGNGSAPVGYVNGTTSFTVAFGSAGSSDIGWMAVQMTSAAAAG
jgi:hypothetical protein